MYKNLLSKCAITITLLFAVAVSGSAQFVHPGILHTQESFDYMKDQVDNEIQPAYGSYELLKSSDLSLSSYSMQGPFSEISRTVGHSTNGPTRDDFIAAYRNALMWKITGDSAHAEKAEEILIAYANEVTVISGDNAPLFVGLRGFLFVNAAEIMRDYMSTSDLVKVQTMFADVFVPVCYEFFNKDPYSNGNWGASVCKGAMGYAIFCDDQEGYDYAKNWYLNGYDNGVLKHYVDNIDGQNQESGRDQGHSMLGIGLLCETAEMAYNQGDDLYSGYDNDNRLLGAFEYIAKYNLGYDVPYYTWTDLTGKYSNWGSISTDDRGDFPNIFEMAYNHYVNRKGFSMPWTEEVLLQIRPEGEPVGGDRSGFGTLLFTYPGNGEVNPPTEAENYSAMSSITSETTTDDGGGENITSIEAADWFEYEIDVPRTGSYVIDYRVASDSTDGSFNLSVNGLELDQISFPTTGGNQTWTTVRSSTPLLLTQGIQTFRITANNADWKINWIRLKLECAASNIVSNIEEFNTNGELISTVQTSDYTILPGNTIRIECKPALDGTWSWIGPNEFQSESRVIELPEIQKNQSGSYVFTYTNACGLVDIDTININVQDSLYIEAENYTLMNGGIVEAATDVSGDSSVTIIGSDSWMEYEVNIPFSGVYSFNYRIASENAGSFDVSTNSEIVNEVFFDRTGDAQTWTTISPESSIYLKAGVQTIRINSESEDWKINWIELKVVQIVGECNLPYSNDGFTVRQNTIEWSSGVIDISCEDDVDIYVFVKGVGDLGELDYFNIYYKLDGGSPVVLKEIQGDVDEIMLSTLALKGTTLELIIESHSESGSQYYKLTQLLIGNERDPFARIEAEDYDEADGTNTESCSDTDGGVNVGYIKDSNWLKFSNINLSEVHSVNMRLASKNSGGTIDVHIDSPTGEIIATVDMPNTGNWQSWKTVSAELQNVIGFYDVYLVFNSSSSDVGNINWLQFSSAVIEDPASIESAEITSDNFILYPNPVDDVLNILDNEGAQLRVINQAGKVVLQSEIRSNHHIESIKGLAPGVYVVQLLKDEKVRSYRVVCK